MSDLSGPSGPPEPEKLLTKEKTRFKSIHDHIPPHLLPDSIPNPIFNLSTATNVSFAQLHRQTEGGKPLSDTLAAGLFQRELSGKFGPCPVTFFQQSSLRISKNRKYGYAIGPNTFESAERSSKSEDVKFLVFVVSSAAGGNRAFGVYRRCDVKLPDVTPEEPFYKYLPEATRSRFKHGPIPCTALVFDSFDDQTQAKIRQETIIDPPDSDLTVPAEPTPTNEQASLGTDARHLTQDSQHNHRDLYANSVRYRSMLEPVSSEGRSEVIEEQFGPPNEDAPKVLYPPLSVIGPDTGVLLTASSLVQPPPKYPKSMFSGRKGKEKLVETWKESPSGERDSFQGTTRPDVAVGIMSTSSRDQGVPESLTKLRAWLSRQKMGTDSDGHTLRPGSDDYLDDGNDEEETGEEVEPPASTGINTKDVPSTPSCREKRKRGTPSSGESGKPTTKHSRWVLEADNSSPGTALRRRHNSRAEAVRSTRNVNVQKERRYSEPALPLVLGDTEARAGGPSPATRTTFGGNSNRLPRRMNLEVFPIETVADGTAGLGSALQSSERPRVAISDFSGGLDTTSAPSLNSGTSTSHEPPTSTSSIPIQVGSKSKGNHSFYRGSTDASPTPPSGASTRKVIGSTMQGRSSSTDATFCSNPATKTTPRTGPTRVERPSARSHDTEPPRAEGSGIGARRPDSSGPVDTPGPSVDGLCLLRGWHAIFMDMDNGLLAEAGLRVTRPETSVHGQRQAFNDHQALLNILETSRGVLSTLARETLSGVGIEIISRQPRRPLQPDRELGIAQGLANASPNRTDLPNLTSPGTSKSSSGNAGVRDSVLGAGNVSELGARVPQQCRDNVSTNPHGRDHSRSGVRVEVSKAPQPPKSNTPQRKRFISMSPRSDPNGSGLMDWAPFAQEDLVDDRGSPMQVELELPTARGASMEKAVSKEEGSESNSEETKEAKSDHAPDQGSSTSRIAPSKQKGLPQSGKPKSQSTRPIKPLPGPFTQGLPDRSRKPGGGGGSGGRAKQPVSKSALPTEGSEDEREETSRTSVTMGVGSAPQPLQTKEREDVRSSSLPKPRINNDPEVDTHNASKEETQRTSGIVNSASSAKTACPPDLTQVAGSNGQPSNELFASVTQSLYDLSLMQKDRMDTSEN